MRFSVNTYIVPKFNLYLCTIVTTVTVMSITIKLIAMRFFDREQEFEKLREIE